jgi:L-amino acid N-acyltransferase YncA
MRITEAGADDAQSIVAIYNYFIRNMAVTFEEQR